MFNRLSVLAMFATFSLLSGILLFNRLPIQLQIASTNELSADPIRCLEDGTTLTREREKEKCPPWPPEPSPILESAEAVAAAEPPHCLEGRPNAFQKNGGVECPPVVPNPVPSAAMTLARAEWRCLEGALVFANQNQNDGDSASDELAYALLCPPTEPVMRLV